MNSAPLNKAYALLAGIVVIMIALVGYMWMDARKFEKSLSTNKTKPVVTATPEQNNSEPVIIKRTEPFSKSDSKFGNTTARSLQQSRLNRDKNSADSTVEQKAESSGSSAPVAGSTDDRLFESAKNLEPESGTTEAKAVPE